MSKQPVVDGIVLAAGASRRMGRSKNTLQTADGETFLEHAVHVLRQGGCRYVVAVIPAGEDWDARLADVSGAAIVENDQPDSEQIDSLRLAIANLPGDADAVAVLPVDFPNVQTQTVQQLLADFAGARAPVTNPAYQGQAGHPVVFERSVLSELLAPDLPEGARSVMDAHERETRLVAVNDPGVLADVDTPADYAQHVENEASHRRS